MNGCLRRLHFHVERSALPRRNVRPRRRLPDAVNTMNALLENSNALRSFLVAEVLRRGGHVRVRVRIRGESMLPTLWPGDLVEIESCSLENVRPGEIVLAQHDERLVLHRLVACHRPNGFLLRGDSVPSPDPVLPPEALLGRLVSRGHDGQTTAARALRQWFSVRGARVLGVLFCYCGIARSLALKVHGWRTRYTLGLERRQPVLSIAAEMRQTASLQRGCQ
jgi:peptidase S24-like protein